MIAGILLFGLIFEEGRIELLALADVDDVHFVGQAHLFQRHADLAAVGRVECVQLDGQAGSFADAAASLAGPDRTRSALATMAPCAGHRSSFSSAFAAALSLSTPLAAAETQTVCTITVNSADEKEAFRRYLPAAKYEFVELVERDRPDWLASACRAGVTCDVLIISGHYDGGNEFFSDRLEVSEFLPVDELERVSCSDSCPGLFSRLKEVHLFGCNTLNPQPQSSASAEIVRSLVREGHSPKEAERQLQIVERGARREQPRPHAPGVQGRAGDLRLLVGGAAGPDRGLHAEPLLPQRTARARSDKAARAAACSGTSRRSR